jgi:hypothetical protein
MGSWLYAKRCIDAGEKTNIIMTISLDTLANYSRSDINDKRKPFASLIGFKREPYYVGFMSQWKAHSGFNCVAWAKIFSKHSRIPVHTVSLPFIPCFGTEIFAWSDDWSFTEQGFPAFTVCDTAFYRSDRYHEAWDIPANLTAHDYEMFAHVVNGLAGMLKEMATQ